MLKLTKEIQGTVRPAVIGMLLVVLIILAFFAFLWVVSFLVRAFFGLFVVPASL